MFSDKNEKMYSHAEMVALCDVAREEQRMACAEALKICDRDVSGECIWFDSAYRKVMNAEG